MFLFRIYWLHRHPMTNMIGLRFWTQRALRSSHTSTLFRRISTRPHERVLTIPNILTFSRLAAAPCLGYLILNHSYPAALGVMVYASVTDYMDGYIARKYQLQSAIGSIIDPMADKALLMTLAGCLTASGDVPLWCGASILGRDILLGLSAVFIRYKTLNEPKTLSRYFNLSIPSVQVTPTTISKWNTFFQMIYLSVCLADQVYPLGYDSIQTGMAACVTFTTIASGISYLFSKTAVKKI